MYWNRTIKVIVHRTLHKHCKLRYNEIRSFLEELPEFKDIYKDLIHSMLRYQPDQIKIGDVLNIKFISGDDGSKCKGLKCDFFETNNFEVRDYFEFYGGKDIATELIIVQACSMMVRNREEFNEEKD